MQPTCEDDYFPKLKRGMRSRSAPKGPPVHRRVEPGKGKKDCPACRFKVRGPNHEQGTHHRRRA